MVAVIVTTAKSAPKTNIAWSPRFLPNLARHVLLVREVPPRKISLEIAAVVEVPISGSFLASSHYITETPGGRLALNSIVNVAVAQAVQDATLQYTRHAYFAGVVANCRDERIRGHSVSAH